MQYNIQRRENISQIIPAVFRVIIRRTQHDSNSIIIYKTKIKPAILALLRKDIEYHIN